MFKIPLTVLSHVTLENTLGKTFSNNLLAEKFIPPKNYAWPLPRSRKMSQLKDIVLNIV